MADQVTKAAGISSESAMAKTGKTLDEWFALLDKAGAADWPHKDIAAHLSDAWNCPGWWHQMIAVAYEQSRGLRVKNQGCDRDFTANASKTIAVPVASLRIARRHDGPQRGHVGRAAGAAKIKEEENVMTSGELV
jgi:hypothetical protein